VQRVQLSSVGGMNCNREVLCGGIIEDSWDGCSPRTELVIMSPITCFSFDETCNPECQHIFGKQTGYICTFSVSLIWAPRNNNNVVDKTEIFTLHWINIIIRNNKCIFTKLKNMRNKLNS
jgi:hypothetical protein